MGPVTLNVGRYLGGKSGVLKDSNVDTKKSNCRTIPGRRTVT